MAQDHPRFETTPGAGGETHQHVAAGGPHDAARAHLTTNQGIRISTIRTA